ncbi:hypothetical protein Hanom_Chr06g00564961 [Helianthus anomalus]
MGQNSTAIEPLKKSNFYYITIKASLPETLSVTAIKIGKIDLKIWIASTGSSNIRQRNSRC